MELLRVLFPKNEDKFNNLNEFSIEEKILILNKDIIREFTIIFIGKIEKIYEKFNKLIKFNICLNNLCYIFFIISKSPRCFRRFWYFENIISKIPEHIWGTLV